MNPFGTAKEILQGVTPWRIIPIAILSTALLAGCTLTEQRIHHFDNDSGPLSASSGSGGYLYQNAGHKAGHMTFGANTLCVREKGAVAILEKPAYRAKVEPVKVEFWLRTFDPAKRMKGSRMEFIAALGRPPDQFDKPYAGAYARKVAGTKITKTCEENVEDGFVDLLVVIKFDKRGGFLKGITINYRLEGKKYALDTRWRIGVCGTAVPKGVGDGSCETGD